MVAKREDAGGTKIGGRSSAGRQCIYRVALQDIEVKTNVSIWWIQVYWHMPGVDAEVCPVLQLRTSPQRNNLCHSRSATREPRCRNPERESWRLRSSTTRKPEPMAKKSARVETHQIGDAQRSKGAECKSKRSVVNDNYPEIHHLLTVITVCSIVLVLNWWTLRRQTWMCTFFKQRSI
jgi:hypothetical protein